MFTSEGWCYRGVLSRDRVEPQCVFFRFWMSRLPLRNSVALCETIQGEFPTYTAEELESVFTQVPFCDPPWSEALKRAKAGEVVEMRIHPSIPSDLIARLQIGALV